MYSSIGVQILGDHLIAAPLGQPTRQGETVDTVSGEVMKVSKNKSKIIFTVAAGTTYRSLSAVRACSTIVYKVDGIFKMLPKLNRELKGKAVIVNHQAVNDDQETFSLLGPEPETEVTGIEGRKAETKNLKIILSRNGLPDSMEATDSQ